MLEIVGQCVYSPPSVFRRLKHTRVVTPRHAVSFSAFSSTQAAVVARATADRVTSAVGVGHFLRSGLAQRGPRCRTRRQPNQAAGLLRAAIRSARHSINSR
jgi:hypothetical protein